MITLLNGCGILGGTTIYGFTHEFVQKWYDDQGMNGFSRLSDHNLVVADEKLPTMGPPVIPMAGLVRPGVHQ